MNRFFLFILIVILGFTILPWFNLWDNEIFGPRLAPPSMEHWLGTDKLGRDVAIRTLEGLTYTIGKGVVVLVCSVIIGVLAAIISIRTYDTLVDRTIGYCAEIIRSFPFLVLLLLCLTLKLPSLPVFLIYYWVPVWRLARGIMIPQRNKPYLLVTYLFGYSRLRAIATELFPNAWPSLTVNIPALLADIIAVMAALEFLGIGATIGQPSLGAMLLDAIELGFSAPWSWLPSLILLVLLIFVLTALSLLHQRAQKWTPLG